MMVPNANRSVCSTRHKRAHRMKLDGIHCKDMLGIDVAMAFERKVFRVVLAVQVLNANSTLDGPIRKATPVGVARNAAQLLAE